MSRFLSAIAFSLALIAVCAAAEDRPAFVVRPFTLAPGTAWPYDMNQLQTMTAAQLKVKLGDRFDVTTELPQNRSRMLTLEGIVLDWSSGNRAKRILIGLGTGREKAVIRYWVVDQNGHKIFEHTDTIRQSVWGGGYVGSVGQLAQPFADKIAARLIEAKIHWQAPTSLQK
jgi:hypothetical protein